jgi:hypothetical protein
MTFSYFLISEPTTTSDGENIFFLVFDEKIQKKDFQQRKFEKARKNVVPGRSRRNIVPGKLKKQKRFSYKAYPGLDSPGNNIGSWKSSKNFGRTFEECKARCDSQPNCKGFGWNPSLKGGYCVSKHKVKFPLKRWNDEGTFYVKQK